MTYRPNRHRGRPNTSAKTGEKLYRDFRVRVCIPGQDDIVWRSRCREARRAWSTDALDAMLEQTAEHIEKRFPSIEFRLVELAPNVFNFIYEGRKTMAVELKIQPCPDAAQSFSVASRICARDGHLITVFQNGMKVTPQGQEMATATFCQHCGFGMAEIRGQQPVPVGASAGPFPISNAKESATPEAS